MNEANRGADLGPRQALNTLRIIGGSMALGVTLFAFVGWFARPGGDPMGPSGSGLVFGGLVVFAVLVLAAAILVWRARVGPLLRARGTEDWSTWFPRLQTHVIIVWALIEAPALAAETVYFLYGDVLSAVLGLAIIWIGIGLTWPRRAWVEVGAI